MEKTLLFCLFLFRLDFSHYKTKFSFKQLFAVFSFKVYISQALLLSFHVFLAAILPIWTWSKIWWFLAFSYYKLF